MGCSWQGNTETIDRHWHLWSMRSPARLHEPVRQVLCQRARQDLSTVALLTWRGCARELPAVQSGTGTLGGCLKGWQFQRPLPSSPLSSSSPSFTNCTPASSGCAVQCLGQYEISRTCAGSALSSRH